MMIRHFGAALGLLLLAGCFFAQGTDEAQEAVDRFRADYASGDYAGLYRATADEFRDTTDEAQFSAIMTTIEQRLGAVEEANQTGWNNQYNNGRQTVTLNYETSYAGGEADETFIVLIEDDVASILGFNINSAALLGPGPEAPAASK